MLHLDAREEKESEEETNKVLSTIKKKMPNNTSQLQQLSVYLVL